MITSSNKCHDRNESGWQDGDCIFKLTGEGRSLPEGENKNPAMQRAGGRGFQSKGKGTVIAKTLKWKWCSWDMFNNRK